MPYAYTCKKENKMNASQTKITKLVKEEKIEDLREFYNQNVNFNFDYTDNIGNNLLHIVAKKQSENTQALITFLVQHNVDINGVNRGFLTPLEVAKRYNNVPAISILNHYLYNIPND